MRLLDLFCGAGGAAVGYHRAGFTDIVGVDIKPQPRYPFDFIEDDVLAIQHWLIDGVFKPRTNRGRYLSLEDFDAIHASPPCQAYIRGLNAVNKRRGRATKDKDYVPQVRRFLDESGLPWVIENVEGAPLETPVVLCGTAFGLPIWRHRLFESNIFLFGNRCEHGRFTEPKYYTSYGQRKNEPVKMNSSIVQVYGDPSNKAKSEWGRALGIDWMTWRELSQAIPPAYTEFIGRQLLAHLKAGAP